jgi:hypothetical protein
LSGQNGVGYQEVADATGFKKRTVIKLVAKRQLKFGQSGNAPSRPSCNASVPMKQPPDTTAVIRGKPDEPRVLMVIGDESQLDSTAA